MNTTEIRLYRLSMVGLPAAAVVGLLAPLLVGFANLSILGLYIAAPLILAPLLVGVYRNRDSSGGLRRLAVDWRLLSTLFHGTIGALVLLLLGHEVRPVTFYFGVAILYALLFWMIATLPSGPAKRAICLYHTAVAVMIVIFSVTLTYDFFVGRTDLSTHISVAYSIVDTGRTPVLFEEYDSFLLWHVYTAATYHLFGGWTTPHTTMYLLSGSVFGGAVALMDAFSRRLYPNERVGLLSALVMISFPLYIFYGMYSIPRSITSILFLLLLLTLVCQHATRMRALSLFVVLGIVVYHPVSIPFVVIILTALYAIERIIGSSVQLVDTFVLSSILLVTCVYWLYRAEYIVGRIAGVVVATLTASSPSATPSGVTFTPWVELANYVPYSFALCLLLVGVLFWLRDERARGSALTSIGLVTVVLLPVVFPGPTLLLDALVGVNIDRFGHYSFMFVALTGGYGLHELLERGGIRLFFVLLVFVSLFSFTAVSNDFVASDNPLVERPFYTFYLSEQERQSFETIDDIDSGLIGADRVSCRYLNEIHFANCELIEAEDGSAMFDDHDAVVLREGELERRPLQLSQYVSDDELPRAELAERNRVFDSGSVSYYQ